MVGRFIIPDSIAVMLEHFEEAILFTNLYAYCLNNPVNMIDSNGEFAMALFGLAKLSLGAIGKTIIAGIATVMPVVAVVATVVAVVVAVDTGVRIAKANNKTKEKKKKESKKSGKEKADDAPSWAKRESYDPKKTASENARNVLDKKYGRGNWSGGPGSEFSQIRKWLQRSKGYK